MPMLTTLRIGLPVWPRHSPERTRSQKSRHPVERLVHLLDDVDAVDDERALARHPQRHVEHGAVLGDVDVLAANIASRRSSTPRSRASSPSSISVSSVIRFFEKSRWRPAPSATRRSPRSGSAAKSSRRCVPRIFS